MPGQDEGFVCRKCGGKVEELQKEGSEVFTDKHIMHYEPTKHIIGSRTREKLAGDHEIERADKIYKVKKLDYKFYCHKCNSVLPWALVRREETEISEPVA